MPLIRETIVSTVNVRGEPHLAPLGLIAEGDGWILAPFHPSTTLENLRHAPYAVANLTDDVRVFAGCLTGRRDWPLTAATIVAAPRLASALAHLELVVVEVREDALRPRFVCRVAHHASHAPFQGFNRAQAAVIEGAVLVSRLHLLPRAEVEAELARLDDRRRQNGGRGGGRGLGLAQGEDGGSLRRRQDGGWPCGSFRSLTSWAARWCGRGWETARPIARSQRRSRQPAPPSTSCAGFSLCIRFARSMSPISTPFSAMATISRRYAAFARSFRHCRCGLTTALPTPMRSRLLFAPISGRRSSAANRSTIAR